MPKPSFFQKLTGTNNEEDTENDEEHMKEKTMTEEKPANDQKEREPIETAAPPEIKKTRKTSKPRSPKMETIIETNSRQVENTAPVSEDWTSESEGQLTIDVYQTPTEIVIKSTVAGVNPDDIDIAISNDMVTIKGFRKKDEEVKTEDYYYQECYWGAFSRSVILPGDVETDKAEAGIKNGVLTIRLPKIEKIQTKKIKVKAG